MRQPASAVPQYGSSPDPNTFLREPRPVPPDPHGWFLAFPPAIRGALGSPFYDAVRAGCCDPEEILDAVRRTFMERRERSKPERAADYDLALAALSTDRDGAIRFAEYALAREAMTESERQAERDRQHAAAAEEARLRSMRGQRSTQGQSDELIRLGYRGQCPADRADASLLIAELKAQREARR